MDRKTEKKIDFYTEVLKILSAFTIAVGGGTAGLFFNLTSPARVALFGVGFFLTAVLIIAIAGVYLKVRHLFWENGDE